jgi:hypothetical protein
LVAGGGEDPGRPTYAESYGHLDGPSSYVPIFTDIDLDYAEPTSVRDQFYQTGLAAPQYAHYPLLPPVKALLHPNIVIHARTAALLAGASRTPGSNVGSAWSRLTQLKAGQELWQLGKYLQDLWIASPTAFRRANCPNVLLGLLPAGPATPLDPQPVVCPERDIKRRRVACTGTRQTSLRRRPLREQEYEAPDLSDQVQSWLDGSRQLPRKRRRSH